MADKAHGIVVKQAAEWIRSLGGGDLVEAWFTGDLAKMATAAANLGLDTQVKLAIELGLIRNEQALINEFLSYSNQWRGTAIAASLAAKAPNAGCVCDADDFTWGGHRPTCPRRKQREETTSMFTNDEKLWITTEFKKQAETFLEHLRLDHTSSMINALTKLEAILGAVNKLTTGKAELHRVIFPRQDDRVPMALFENGKPK